MKQQSTGNTKPFYYQKPGSAPSSRSEANPHKPGRLNTNPSSKSLSKTEFKSFIEAQQQKVQSQQQLLTSGDADTDQNIEEEVEEHEKSQSQQQQQQPLPFPLPRLAPKNYLSDFADPDVPVYKGFYSHTPALPVYENSRQRVAFEEGTPVTNTNGTSAPVNAAMPTQQQYNGSSSSGIKKKLVPGKLMVKTTSSKTQFKRPGSSLLVTNNEAKMLHESTLFIGLQHSKVQRNELIEANHGLRERIVNLERDIKIMMRQLSKWSSESQLYFDPAQTELFLDKNACSCIYADPNFYLVSLQKRVKTMQAEETELIDQMRKYTETMRVIRTDIRSEARRVDLEKTFMKQHHEYLELQQSDTSGFLESDDGSLKRQRDALQSDIARVREDNKTIIVELQLSQEMFDENQAEIDKHTKKQAQRQKKIADLEKELAGKHPHDKREHKLEQKRVIRILDEQKRNIQANQANLILQQNETINQLQLEFQKFRNSQILSTQQAMKEEKYLLRQINQLKEDYVAIQTAVAKKKKIIRAELMERKLKQEEEEKKQAFRKELPPHDGFEKQEEEEEEEEEKHDDVGTQEQQAQQQPQQHQQTQLDTDGYQIEFEEEENIVTIQSEEQHQSQQLQVQAANKKQPAVNRISIGQIQRQSSIKQYHDVATSRTGTQIVLQTAGEQPLITEQSLRSTFKGVYGDQMGSKYNDDHSLSHIFGVQVVE